MARPRIEIDKNQFEKLCSMQCTKEEVASFFNCSEDTIDRWCKRTYKESFAVVLIKKGAAGKISLRRSQFQLAEKNAAMAIWLGKQYLGQREDPTTAGASLEKLNELLNGLTYEAERQRNQ